jgi:glutamyl-tRNA synthetase
VSPALGLSYEDLAVLIRAMPELKARAHNLNELADGAAFLFARRPLDVDPKASELLTDEARVLSQAHMKLLLQLRIGHMTNSMLRCERLRRPRQLS